MYFAVRMSADVAARRATAFSWPSNEPRTQSPAIIDG